jgi:cell division protein FtsB
MKQELRRIEESNHELNVKNRELFSRIRKLSRSKSVQEEAIRRELGWVKNGEIVLEFFSAPLQELKKSHATFSETGDSCKKSHPIGAK